MTPPDFRVGLSPDWTSWAAQTLPSAIAEVLEPLPGLTYEVMPEENGAATREILDRYDAIIAFGYPFPASAIGGVRRLTCIARWGVGFDKVDVPTCTASDVMVSLSPGAVRRPVAEGIMTLIFALAKNVRSLDAYVRTGKWRQNLSPQSICVQNRTLGSIGMGNIAGELFRMARGVGFGRLISYDPYGQPERAAELGVQLTDLDTVLRESDFIAVNAPLNEDTRGIIGEREIGLMKPSAYLINTSRGPLVQEAPLIQALKERRIAGAGLDVFEHEPLPPAHPFYELDNVVLTPHAIGWSEELIRDLDFETCQCVCAVYEGRVPPNLANPEVATQAGFQSKLSKRRSV